MVDWIKGTKKKYEQGIHCLEGNYVIFIFLYKWMSWKEGDGKKVILGRDPFIGGNGVYNFLVGLNYTLDSKGINYLNVASNRDK